MTGLKLNYFTMKKITCYFAVLIFAGMHFSGCVSDIANPEESAAAAAVSIKIVKPVSHDSISYKGSQVDYTLVTNNGINFIELHVNGKCIQTFKPNSDGSKPVISINLDSTYINSNITYQIKYFDNKGYAETPVYTVYVTEMRNPPYPPYGITLTKLYGMAYNISWKDSSTNISYYEIWRKTENGQFGLFTTIAPGAFNVNDLSLEAGKVYSYKIRGNNKFGFSDFSTVVSTSGSDNATGINAPNLWSGYAESTSSIVVIWTDNNNNENYFAIERKSGYTGFVRVGATLPNLTSYRDSIGLLPGVNYTYRVKVYSSNDSACSNEYSVKTFTYNLLAPSITSVSNSNATKINIKWKDNDNYDGRFVVERKEGNGNYAVMGETDSWVNTFDDLSITPQKTYTYRVREYMLDSYSQYSNEMGISTAGLPNGTPQSVIINFSPAPISVVNLSWTLSDQTVTKVFIERRLSTDPISSYVVIGEVNSWTRSFSDGGTSCGLTYAYRLRSTDNQYFSDYTQEYFVKNTNTCK